MLGLLFKNCIGGGSRMEQSGQTGWAAVLLTGVIGDIAELANRTAFQVSIGILT